MLSLLTSAQTTIVLASHPPITATLLGQTGEDVVGKRSLGPDGVPDVHVRLSGVSGTISNIRITGVNGGIWEMPLNTQGNWLVATAPTPDPSVVDVFFDYYKPISSYTLAITYTDGQSQTVVTTTPSAPVSYPPTPSAPVSHPPITATLLGQTGEDVVGKRSLGPDGVPDVHVRLSGVSGTISNIRITGVNGIWEMPLNAQGNWLVATAPTPDPSVVDVFFDYYKPISSYTLAITYTDGQSQTVVTTAPQVPTTFNFSLFNTGDKSVNAASSVSNTITATLVSGNSQPIAFSIAGLPSGATASLSQVTCNPSCSSLLTLTTTTATSGGNFPITVTAAGGGITKSTSFNLTVLKPTTPFDFSLSHSGNKLVDSGSSVTNTVTATLVSGTSQQIAFSIAGLPAGTMASLSTATCNPSCSSILTINTISSTPGGSFPITVTATGGGVTKTTTFTLSVTVALTVATPTISPNGGSFSALLSPTMATATPGASIYYTTNGSTPSQSSRQYTGAITLTSTTTVKAKAFKSGYNPSAEVSASFTAIPSSAGQTYYVARNGNDNNPGTLAQPFLTIFKGMQAISAAGPGSTLYIRGGTYQGWTAAEANSINPRGTDWTTGAINVKNYSGETVTITSKTTSHIITIIRAKYLIFDGESATTPRLIFDGQTTTSGVNISGTDVPADSSFVRMTNFEVKRARGNGVLIAAGHHNEFLNCKVHDNGTSQQYDHGFYIVGPDNLVEQCAVYNNTGFGVHIYGSEKTNPNARNIIRNNRIYGNRNGIIVGKGPDHIVYNNLVYQNQDIGIWLDYFGGGSVYNNTVTTDRSSHGNIWVGGGALASIIENNIASRIWIDTPSSQSVHTVRNNLVILDSFTDFGRGTIKSGNLVGVDPRFMNAAMADFQLQAGSPAIDKGLVIPDVATDFDATARPQGAGYDIGAYEFGGVLQ